MGLKEIGINMRIWFNSAKDRDYWKAFVNVALNLRVTYARELVKPAGKRPLGRRRRRWEDNIRMDLEEISVNADTWLIRPRIGIIGEPL